MDVTKIKLLAFDLDGTLTRNKTKINATNRQVLEALSKKYKLLMVGAGSCRRIFEQLDRFPVDILGNYGLQYAEYDAQSQDIKFVESVQLSYDRDSIEKRATLLRETYGFTEFVGDNVEYHSSGFITIPLLGTDADFEDKLVFDPDRKKRRAIYEEVKAMFPDYTTFVAGSSSFDFAPAPYNKAYALSRYCAQRGIAHNEVIFMGDDYGPGGNDESVYQSDFNFITVDDYLEFPKLVEALL